jgi:hypothetical protein
MTRKEIRVKIISWYTALGYTRLGRVWFHCGVDVKSRR